MFKKLRIKLFGRSKKEIYRDIHFLCLEISDTLEDISEDLDNIHESVQESLRLTLKIQDQCNEIIKIYESMQKRDRVSKLCIAQSGLTQEDLADTTEDGFDNGDADE